MTIGNPSIRHLALRTASGGALLLALATGAAAQQEETIIVSSTRITAQGFDAPTPTTVVGADLIERNAASNIFTTITELPSLQGSTGTGTGNGGTSGGTNGLSSFGMRGMGPIRTLVLIDGQRVVPANVTGIADISQFPQLLVERVDVVTGGASASWGSDAVAGVVNFVTNKRFEGFKANFLGGVSTYGDAANATVQMAAGTSFAGGKGHIQLSAEYGYEQGIPPGDFGITKTPNGRDWYKAANILQQTVTNIPAGQAPRYFYAANTKPAGMSKYGLITAGPLRGIAFGPNGQPFQFDYGGGPNGAGIANCVGSFCIGGDTTANVGNGITYLGALTRGNVYGRVSYEVAPGIELYATVNIANVYTANQPNPGARRENALQIGCDNPFLPAGVAAGCLANAGTGGAYAPSSTRPSSAGTPYPQGSFTFGVSNAIFPQNILVKSQRGQRRFVVGASGAFNMLGSDWTFDTYFQHGETGTSIHVRDILLLPRYNAAIDAIAGPNGTVICRSAVARAAGCTPINILGDHSLSASQIQYVQPANGPYQLSRQRQEAFSANINGTPFENWAGNVSVAAGVEYREEAYSVEGDPYGNGGGLPATPYNAAYPADPLLNATEGNDWYAGNFHNGMGYYNVYEAFLETVVPIFNTDSFGKFDLNLAGRATRYSTAGDVVTWKVGATWQTPLDGVRFRAVQSRDVRAPNLSELFAAPIVTHSSVQNRFVTPVTVVDINQAAVGNTALGPEKAQTTEVGVVFQPSWLPGFQASFDYWRVAVKGQIQSLTAQQEVDLCAASNLTSPVCSAINLTTQPYTIQVQVFNLASVVTDGFDIEASYQFDLEDWDIPGQFVFRNLVTHTTKFLSNTGILNQPVLQTAGNNTGNVPLWKARLSQDWNSGTWAFGLVERWFSDGVFNKNFVVCTANCPAPTLQNPTINYNTMPGAFYLDIGGSKMINDTTQIYFKINNITNKAPEPSPGTAINNNGINPFLYDVIGRMYRVGIRLNN